MELRFLPPEPRRFDEASVELCACSVWSDQRPARGFAGLVDWQLDGRLSAMQRVGFLRGDRGEALLVPGKPHLPFEKVLVLGLGRQADFDDDAFRAAVEHLSRALERLRVRRAVVELPGRPGDGIDAERAITLTLEVAGGSAEHDVWWLVDTPAAQRRIEQRAAEERRRARSL
jgi:hypothetical protein